MKSIYVCKIMLYANMNIGNIQHIYRGVCVHVHVCVLWSWENINSNPASWSMGLFQTLGLESTESSIVS